MARRRGSKLQNAVTTMRFEVAQSGAPQYLDLSAAASVLNRRFYRQGLQWAVSGFTVIAPSGSSGDFTITKLPTNWTVSNSWEKGFRAWQRQQNDALEDASIESVKAKYNDFKIYADQDHFGTAAPHFLAPRDGDNNPFKPPQEWLYSEVVVPNADGVVGNTLEFKLHMMGDDTATGLGAESKSLIKAYSESRSVPQSPDPSTPGTASVGLYVNMFNDGMNDSEIVANAEFRNDELPYDQDEYPGSRSNGPGMQLVDTLYVNTTVTAPGKFTMAGGLFPCGIVKFQNGVSDAIDILVHLVPGSHRGYLCEPMTEM